ncbi:MAG: hypothetical protein ACYDES_07570 [Acidimicrobiales bacterium]
MIIEDELDADISGFRLNALASALPLNADLDTTLTVLAGNAYRLWPASSHATSKPPPIGSGATSSTTPARSSSPRTTSASTSPCAPTTPVLIDAGYPEVDLPVPWWGGRTLRFGFPPR